MDFLTHLLVGRLLAEGVGGGATALGALATLFAVLPDFDTISWLSPRARRYVRHRGATHTLLFGAVTSVLAGVLFHVAGWAPFHVAAPVAALAFLSHVGLDVLNWGAPLLAPWRRGRIEWTVHGGFAWSAGLSLAGLLALELARAWVPQATGPLAAAFGAAVAGYFAMRIGIRLALARRHAGRRLLPTGNPFVWRVLDDDARAA